LSSQLSLRVHNTAVYFLYTVFQLLMQRSVPGYRALRLAEEVDGHP